MALTVAQLAAAIRVGTTQAERDEITRLKAYGETEIDRFADGAPSEVKDEALVRIVGYLYDAPTTAYANAVQNSGAAAMLLPYRVHRAGIISGATPTQIVPSTSGVQVGGGGGVEVGGGGGESEPDPNNDGGGASEAEIKKLQEQIDDNAADIADNKADIATTRTSVGTVRTIAEQRGMPSGGTDGQVLTKTSATDYDAEWQAPKAGSDSTAIAAQLEVVTRELVEADPDEAWINLSNGINTQIDYSGRVALIKASTIGQIQETLKTVDLRNTSGPFTHSGQEAILEKGLGWPTGNQAIVAIVGRQLPQDSNANTKITGYRAKFEHDGEITYITSNQWQLSEIGGKTADNPAGADFWYIPVFDPNHTQAYIRPINPDITKITIQGKTGGTEYRGNVTGGVAGVEASIIAQSKLPAGGTEDYVLTKKSGKSYDVEWKPGGGSGQDPNIPLEIEALQHATRQVEILSVDKWKPANTAGPNRTEVTIVQDNSPNANVIQNSRHWAPKLNRPQAIFGNSEVRIYIRTQVHNGKQLSKEQIRFVAHNGDRNTNSYAYANQLKLDSGLAQSAWTYYRVYWLGQATLIPGEATAYYAAEIHESEETVWGGEVSGKVQAAALIDDVAASTVADALVPAGGKTNEVLAKSSDTDYELKWLAQSAGGGGFSLTKINQSDPAIDPDNGRFLAFDATDAAAIFKAAQDGRALWVDIRSSTAEGILIPVTGGAVTVPAVRSYTGRQTDSNEFVTAKIALIKMQISSATLVRLILETYDSSFNESSVIRWRLNQKADVYSIG